MHRVVRSTRSLDWAWGDLLTGSGTVCPWGGPVRGVLTAGLCRSRSYRTTWGSTLPASARDLSSSRRRAVRPGPRGGRHGARCCANHASVRAQASPAARALYRGPVSLKKA
jgi:hypothetical protein